MFTGLLRLLSGLLVALCCSVAFAQDQGAYLGVSVGQSKVKDPGSCSDLAGLFSPGYSCSLNDTDVGLKIFGGYQVNRYVGAEVSYVDLGTFKLSASGLVTGVPVSASEKIHGYGFGADLVLSAPISDTFSLSARGGVLSWTLKDTLSASSSAASLSQEESATGTSFTFGVGARYDFAQNLGFRVEFQRFKDVGDENKTGKSDVDLISASLIYRFR